MTGKRDLYKCLKAIICSCLTANMYLCSPYLAKHLDWSQFNQKRGRSLIFIFFFACHTRQFLVESWNKKVPLEVFIQMGYQPIPVVIGSLPNNLLDSFLIVCWKNLCRGKVTVHLKNKHFISTAMIVWYAARFFISWYWWYSFLI